MAKPLWSLQRAALISLCSQLIANTAALSPCSSKVTLLLIAHASTPRASQSHSTSSAHHPSSHRLPTIQKPNSCKHELRAQVGSHGTDKHKAQGEPAQPAPWHHAPSWQPPITSIRGLSVHLLIVSGWIFFPLGGRRWGRGAAVGSITTIRLHTAPCSCSEGRDRESKQVKKFAQPHYLSPSTGTKPTLFCTS